MTEKNITPRRWPTPGQWITTAAVLGYGGAAVMLTAAFTSAPRFLAVIGIAMFGLAVPPYLFALYGKLHQPITHIDRRHQELMDSLQAAQQSLNDTHREQMARMDAIHDQIKATTRKLHLSAVEEAVYAEILGIAPETITFMVWPEDGLRDSVIVYRTEGRSTAHPLTIDQMNQAAEAINERMAAYDREEET